MIVGKRMKYETEEEDDLLLLLMCFFTSPSTSSHPHIPNHLTLGIVFDIEIEHETKTEESRDGN